MLEKTDEAALLMSMLDASVSSYHCVKNSKLQLKQAGFEEVLLDKEWKLESGKKYFTEVFGSTLVAFKIPRNYHHQMVFHLAAAHTDWPTFKIKPNPEMETGIYGKLNVETYGGPIFSTWLDRPLSIAGRVAIHTDDYLKPEIRLVDFKRPLVTIPNLAIHFNREVNNGVALNAQIDMTPLLGLLSKEMQKEEYFLNLLAEELEIKKEKILSYDLNLYNTEHPTFVGMNSEFLSAPRLDNITSVQACLSGIIKGKNEEVISVIALFDNEEIGSSTKQGADSLLLTQILEKIILCLGGTRQNYLNSVMGGMMLSADVAHAIHPNHSELNDLTNKIYPGEGVSLKMHYGQRYATDVEALSIVEGLCKQEKIPYTCFLNRSDIRGGSTLGSIASSKLIMKTVDLGIAILAMHSARELMAVEDQYALAKLMIKFL